MQIKHHPIGWLHLLDPPATRLEPIEERADAIGLHHQLLAASVGLRAAVRLVCGRCHILSLAADVRYMGSSAVI